ncbi:MFS transporter [Hamadaea sp. NPDC051192]|uniref:MFS transporter n=1 Tax=Hamadaea sp. NPDC051192 TaxID=3154940 RepID=UPI0034184AF8
MKQMSRDFRLLAAGQGLSWLGNGFQTVALAVAILLAGGGAGDLGLVMAASVVAMLCGTLFGGVWADRMQPQRVMVLSDVVRAVAATGIALVFGTGHYSLPLVMAFAAISAGAGAFFGPAFTSLKPMLVPVDRRQSANATLSLLQTTCAVIGPALGGLVVARFGATTGFAVNAFSFAVSTVTALLIRARVTRPPRQGMLRELSAGWLEIRRRDWLLVGVLAATVYHIANGVVLVLIQVLAIERLGGASAAGLVAAAEGLGGVVGAAVGMRFKPRRLLRAGWLTLMLMPVWVLVYVWPGVLTAVAAGAVVGYAGLAFFSVAWETALQDHIPHDRLARVASWDMLTSFLAMPLGNALAGPLAAAFGYDPVLVVCAIVLLGASVTPLAVAGSRRLTRSTVETAAAPEPATASV